MHHADSIHLTVQRGLSGEARLQIALDMCTAARELALARLRRQYPAWPIQRLRQELVRQTLRAEMIPTRIQ
jgi:hypothetical protein